MLVSCALMAACLPEEIVELIASGVDVCVATRDAALEPEAMFAMGIRPSADRRVITVYLPQVLSARTCQNLAENADIAVTLERPIDLRAVQIKGRALAVRPSEEVDRERQAVFRAALVEAFGAVGIPRSVTRRLRWWPSVAVDVEVRDVFLQTPGASAGEPMPGS
jgi:pyridoxamine 5'-phosphate oxidase-like protein